MSEHFAGGLVDMFASQAQSLMDASVLKQAKRDFVRNLRPSLMRDVPHNGGALVVLAVFEPRSVDLFGVPRQRIYQSITLAGVGLDRMEIKAAYLRQPKLVAAPPNKQMMRKEYFIWMRPSDVTLWALR